MESYIEITLITNFLVCVFSYYASLYFSLSKKQNVLFYALLCIEQLLHISSVYHGYFILYECIFMIYTIKQNIKVSIMYISLKYLNLFTMYKLFGGSFYMGHYYVSIYTNMIYIWLFYLLCIVLLKVKWHMYIFKQDFIYNVYFYTTKRFRIKGYLDSGNSVSYKNVPILFVDVSYQHYFNDLSYTYCYIETLNSNKIYKIYTCEVWIKGYKRREYYICCDEHIHLEFNCRCLLNIES